MNLNKAISKEESNNVSGHYTYIEISHYDDDKLMKTETFPLSHFLEGFEKEFKRVRYN
tara:strand:+ start:1126 stop:1299 length:174 start_codon:yes stop_codon:yes gene_type:complete